MVYSRKADLRGTRDDRYSYRRYYAIVRPYRDRTYRIQPIRGIYFVTFCCPTIVQVFLQLENGPNVISPSILFKKKNFPRWNHDIVMHLNILYVIVWNVVIDTRVSFLVRVLFILGVWRGA